MIIDAHQHFWRLERGDYGWLTPELAPIYRDFGPSDLAPHLARQGIGGTVLVQAAPTLAETEYLLELAGESDVVRGVVGWVDFEATSAPEEIARLARHPKLVGLRPMIQDIADDDWMLDPVLAPAFEAMIRHDLTFDALVLPRHLPRLRRLLARHPDLRCVIDHGAKPEIAAGRFDAWAGEMAALARETRAWCKLSGLLTEAGEGAGRAELEPYVAHLVAQFGPARLVWGSDWPVLTLAASYEAWFEMARSLIPDAEDRRAVFGGNAAGLYRL
ncbi:amidohydrolase family protein [Limimaricola litoreus]|uniref:Amidohydrolase family protein n=1 Tax=Limimaricola litoreus TaxID=2955316 RepID=A0A9X2JNB2_9RHOB|nr:amidohydrolase family protein [Limimaricola litoreus]MCP1168552.1 amidohydrolase family protein [Limimaricola litoreus]